MADPIDEPLDRIPEVCRGSVHVHSDPLPAGERVGTCEWCGRNRCTGKSKLRHGADADDAWAWQRCRLSPHPGSNVCTRHGAARGTRAHRKAADRIALHKAGQTLGTLGLPRRVDATTALQEELWRTAGYVAWIEATVSDIHPDALVWGVTKLDDHEASEFPGVNVLEQAALNVWLVMLGQERDRLVKVAAAIAKLGLDQQALDLRKEQANSLVRMLRRLLVRLGLDPMDPAVFTVVQEELRAMSASASNAIEGEVA